MTYKDPGLITLIDTVETKTAQFLKVDLLRCDPNTSGVACAGDEEIREFQQKHRLLILTANNFIDYAVVDPYKGPLRHTASLVDT